jgi:hypothetical protein
MAEGLGGKRRFSGLDLAYALSVGTKTAYGAVAKPVEGTILTVIRDSAAAAVAAAERDDDIEAVLVATVEAAEKSVAATPSLLPILREAGVVDSGGQGLFRLFQGALQHMAGQTPAAARPRDREERAKPSTLVAHADEGFGYETMFLLQAAGARPIDVDALRNRLETIGDSVLVAGDSRAVKVHVHNDRPDLVIGHGLTIGTLSRISVENLDNQARDVREARAASFTGVAGTAAATAAPAGPPATEATASGGAAAVDTAPATTSTNGTGPSLVPADERAPAAALAVIAVAAGDGLGAIFSDFGVAEVIHGGQTANPSTGELLEAIERVDAEQILLLPNNPNVILAARQVTSMTKRPVAVVPTRNAAEGFAALLSLDPTRDAAANAGPMTAAARSVQTMSITEAVRDATIGGRKVKHGQTIALDPDDGLIAVHNDRDKCVLAAVARLDPGFELITVFYGQDATLADAEAVARRIQGAVAGIDVEVRHGGQPFYRYLIAAE